MKNPFSIIWEKFLSGTVTKQIAPFGDREVNLTGMMGMSEMESAIKILLSKAEKQGLPFHHVTVYVSDFKGNEMAMLGFCHLLAGRWLETTYPNYCFKMSEKLIVRIAKFVDDEFEKP